MIETRVMEKHKSLRNFQGLELQGALKENIF